MGKFLNDPRKGLARIKIGKRNNRALVALANTLVLKMTGNISYTTPLPSLASVTTAAINLRNAAALTDFKRNRGSKAQMQATIDANAILRNLLIQLINYIQNTAQTTSTDNINLTQILASSGVGLRHTRAVRPAPQMATFVQQNNNKQFTPDLLRLKWKKSLAVLKGQPLSGYNIVVGGVIVATTTATFHQFPPTLVAGTIEGYIVPFNHKGSGRKQFFTIRTTA